MRQWLVGMTGYKVSLKKSKWRLIPLQVKHANAFYFLFLSIFFINVGFYCITRKHDLLVTLMLGSLGEGEGAGKLSGDAFICRLRMIAVALIGVLPPLTLTPIH